MYIVNQNSAFWKKVYVLTEDRTTTNYANSIINSSISENVF